jgi:hypothetical protein
LSVDAVQLSPICVLDAELADSPLGAVGAVLSALGGSGVVGLFNVALHPAIISVRVNANKQTAATHSFVPGRIIRTADLRRIFIGSTTSALVDEGGIATTSTLVDERGEVATASGHIKLARKICPV